ncbi:MAG: signal peptidase II [Verrucomicrobia bacterium GWF2_51_19]|nr:MAG: signal peptidase II [Verrucomicrobia bacterium GWF2_51_19]HCJ11590.1 signal peptidase II [Opitutae bacterium]
MPLFLVIAFIVFTDDRISKNWLISHFEVGESIRVFEGFYITRVHNTGAAWGLFQNASLVLAALAILACLAIFYFRKTWINSKISQGLMGALVGGILGNLFDRLSYGYVIDFIDVHLPFYHWPTFNIADCAIVLGAISMSFLYGRK